MTDTTTQNFILYTTDMGNTNIQIIADSQNETIWLSQKQISEIFEVTTATINEHIKNIYSSNELEENATIRNFLIVQREGQREVERNIAHYNLDMIISIGYRVNSYKATQFRIWATKTLREFIIKGFVLDDERLKQTILQEAIEGKLTAKWRAKNPDTGTAKELLEQIRKEKEKLVKEKKIKASKLLPPINEDEIPFDRSENTIFVRLIDLFNIEKGQTGISKAIEGKYPLVVTAQERLSHNEYQVDGEAIIIPLVSSTGHGHASMNRIHYQSGKFAIGSILSVLTPIHKDLISTKFYYEYLLQNKDELLVKKMTGAANVTLTLSALFEVIVPYISINIQKKIEEVFNICDEFEGEINQNKTTVENLMATVLKEAFE